MTGLFNEGNNEKKDSAKKSKRSNGKNSTRKKMLEPKSFEIALEELETLVDELDSGDVNLEKSVELFERAQFLAKWCQKKLDKIEGELKLLVANDEGGFDVEPLDYDSD